MKKINLLLVALGMVLISSCCTKKAGVDDPIVYTNPLNFPTVVGNDFQCSPQTVGLDGSVSIRFPVGHGSDFAIVDESGNYWFISFTPTPGSKVLPVIPPQVFKNMQNLTLRLSDVKGVLWSAKAGNEAPQTIFKAPGKYSVLVSYSLETEDPVLDGGCVLNVTK